MPYFNRHQNYIYCLIAFILGVFLGNFVHYRPVILILGLAVFLIGLIFKPIKHITLGLIFCLIGVFYFGFYRQQIQITNLPFNQTISFQGLVLSVEQKNEKQNTVVKTKNWPKNPKIQIFSILKPNLKFGDQLEIEGKLEKPKKFNDFDYPGFLERQGILGLIYQPTKVKIIRRGQGNFLVSRIINLRNQFEISLNHSLPEPYSSLTAGILLGSKRNLSADLKEKLNLVGLSHIVAVSGSNLTIIVAILIGLSLGRTIKFRYWALTVFIIFFVILTGASASIVRGGLVAWLLIWARANSRIAWPVSLILTTILIMVLHNPLILKNDLGFQLSTAAFVGLLFISPLVKNWLRTNQLQNLPDFIRLPAVETFSATLPTIPLTAYYFGRVSLISILANVLVLWTIPLIMALGFIVGITGIIQPFLGQIAAQLLVVIEKYLLLMIDWTSRIPWASINL